MKTSFQSPLENYETFITQKRIFIFRNIYYWYRKEYQFQIYIHQNHWIMVKISWSNV